MTTTEPERRFGDDFTTGQLWHRDDLDIIPEAEWHRVEAVNDNGRAGFQYACRTDEWFNEAPAVASRPGEGRVCPLCRIGEYPRLLPLADIQMAVLHLSDRCEDREAAPPDWDEICEWLLSLFEDEL